MLAIQTRVAKSDTLEGTLHSQIIDRTDGSAENRFWLVTEDGDSLKLHPSDGLKDSFYSLAGSDKVQLGAQPILGAAVGGSGERSLEYVVTSVKRAIKNNQHETLQARVDPLGVVSGSRAVAIVLVNVSTSTAVLPAVMGRDEAISALYSGTHSVNGAYEASSLDQLSFNSDKDGDGNPDVFGPYSVPMVSSPCDKVYDWSAEVLPLAQVDGLNSDAYDHVVFVMPDSQLLGCNWGGLGEMPGKFSWIAATYSHVGLESFQIFAHEIGHNLGLNHASIDQDRNGAINGTNEEYGDWTCLMSNGWHAKLFNAAHSMQLGWYLNYPEVVKTISGPGSYSITLSPLELNPAQAQSGLQIVRILPVASSDPLVLSYRQQVGTYNQIPLQYTSGVNVIKDLGLYKNTLLLGTLTDRGTFVDPNSGISVTQVAHDSNGVTFSVEVPLETLSTSTIQVASKLLQRISVIDGLIGKLSNPNSKIRKASLKAISKYSADLSAFVDQSSAQLKANTRGPELVNSCRSTITLLKRLLTRSADSKLRSSVRRSLKALTLTIKQFFTVPLS